MRHHWVKLQREESQAELDIAHQSGIPNIVANSQEQYDADEAEVGVVIQVFNPLGDSTGALFIVFVSQRCGNKKLNQHNYEHNETESTKNEVTGISAWLHLFAILGCLSQFVEFFLDDHAINFKFLLLCVGVLLLRQGCDSCHAVALFKFLVDNQLLLINVFSALEHPFDLFCKSVLFFFE